MNDRSILFLQGPHGPFFRELASHAARAGAEVSAVGFNEGDARVWRKTGPYTPYLGPAERYADWIAGHLRAAGVTDLAVYGDTRFFHAEALSAARALGVRTHCFEEGYLRPYWITYERDGVNGHSRLMRLRTQEMEAALSEAEGDGPPAPPHWGAAWSHALLGFGYHFNVLARNRAYPKRAPHRPTGLWRELLFYLKRLVLLPLLAPQRRWREHRLGVSGKIYHLALLQLSADSSIRDHSRFENVREFIEICLDAFAEGAPRHHHLVFKAHPFEDGRERLERAARMMARDLGVADRIVFLQGGKLGPLLDRCRSVVTINSTAAQQALYRGLPVRALGDAVYDKPEFLSNQGLAAFFADPMGPDMRAYREYRRFLLATSQVMGGFYTPKGRAEAISGVLDMMLDEDDPYDRLFQRALARQEEILQNPRITVLPRRA